MRQIKFRAWDSEQGRMFNSDDGNGFRFCIDPFGSHYVEDLKGNQIVPDGEYWMQFTGLLDKNGKEIYEGDIVEIDVQLTRMAGIDTNRLAVEFSDGAFYPRPHGEVFEIIGNIYENPDLLTPPTPEE